MAECLHEDGQTSVGATKVRVTTDGQTGGRTGRRTAGFPEDDELTD